MFVKACQGQARDGSQPVHFLPPGRVPGHAAVKVAEERLGEPAQGCKGVLAAAGGAARAGHEQVGMLGQRRAAKASSSVVFPLPGSPLTKATPVSPPDAP